MRQSEQVGALSHNVRMKGNDLLGHKVRTALPLNKEKSGRGIIHLQITAVTSFFNPYHYDHLFKLTYTYGRFMLNREHHEVSFLSCSPVLATCPSLCGLSWWQ